MKEELENLEKAFSNPKKPVVAIFGGAKVSDKIGVLKNIVDRMDSILIGGGMANTFLKSQGVDVQASSFEAEMLVTAAEIIRTAAERGCSVLLPEDVVAAPGIGCGAESVLADVTAIPVGMMALDIGSRTIEAFGRAIDSAATIVWNGPMGVFEEESFCKGTMAVAKSVAESRAFSVVGGGDTIRALRQSGLSEKICTFRPVEGPSWSTWRGRFYRGFRPWNVDM